VTLHFIDWIWHVRGSLTLAPMQSGKDAFDRLDPLFHQSGTTRERTQDRLTFRKRNQAAQDKMSIFDSGVLQIEESKAGSVLRYHLVSRALLFCFMAPLLFLGIAQLTMTLGKLQKASTEAAGTSRKATDASKKHTAAPPMNPIDKMLGAPTPEKPGKDGDDMPGKRGKKPSPTPAYVFAGIFAVLYGIGRILEDRLAKTLFRKHLLGQ
jgi:hypothetical protein